MDCLGVGVEFKLNMQLVPSLQQVRGGEQAAARARAATIFLAHDVGGKQKRCSVLHAAVSLNQFEEMQPGQARCEVTMNHSKCRRVKVIVV
jgi:hypothetical protein